MTTMNYQVQIISEEKGKGLIALSSYKDGDEIFTEKPLVSCQFSWNADCGYLACDNCMQPLETAEENARRLTGNKNLILPHQECCETQKNKITQCPACGIGYCSVDCLNEAYQKYHQVVCLQSRVKDPSNPLIRLKETWKQMHYPPETATIMLIAKIIAIVNQSPDKAAVLSGFNEFCHKTINNDQQIVHNLLGDKFIGQIDVLREMMEYTINTEHVPHWTTPEGFRSLLGLIGTNGQGIGTSAFSRWVKNVTALELPADERIHVDKFIDQLYDQMDEVAGSFLNNEGSGLYALQSSINHSCSPNAIIEFPYSNSTLVVKAIKNIQPGEEVTIGYLDECELERSRHSRQKALSSLYLFKCQCDKCIDQADDPDVTSDDDDDEDDDDMSSD
ncbi:SET and MYND domain-containing protein 5 [Aphidius gifuensis]|uniref:SET and MYND domain-containing protein 5 n=1 Tax=Aphidius gifuensis TaxID=684658 RepID=UPI001CDCCB71|nr:SET and MYND domain-containing protein 5 [Aphidius gifuensis]XP_044017429.1 SET and MYND domain-containing protein 5 [Aphidius gifuensis]XP_044017430.1 SET and MYND domain-containing protein 5 [Aphidius gifuensis]